MAIELRNHPAQADSPDGGKLTDGGKPVPLFPNQRSILLDGRLVGYVGEPPARNLSFIVPLVDLPANTKQWVSAAVLKEFGEVPAGFSSVPKKPTDELESYDDAE